MKKYRNISVVMWSSVLAFLFVLSLSQSRIMGDGYEYLMYARAFATHLSPDFRRDDVMHVAIMLDKSDPGFRANLNNLGRGKTVGDLQYGKGFVTSPEGELHSWHFWLYSLFSAPFFELTQRIGLPPAAAFTLCNWAFIFGAISYILFFWNGSFLQKNTLAALFLLTGTTYYVWWSHPEVFTASLMLMALMMTSDKRYVLAMFSGAVAATQNPPLVILISFIALYAIMDIIRNINGCSMLKKLSLAGRKIVPSFLLSMLIATIPVLYFIYTLGVINPIAAGGGTNPDLISVDRMVSLFFDINLGMVVAAPGVILSIVVLLLSSPVESRFKAFNGVMADKWFLISCILLSIAMSIPALSTTNWNHGHSVYSRYAYWLGIPLIYGLVVSMRGLRAKMHLVVAIATVTVQFNVVAYYGLFGKNSRSHYTNFKAISNYVLINYPQLYNPIPEIFIERINHREGIPKIDNENQSVFAYPSPNNPSKLLLPNAMADSVAKKCPHKSIVRAEGGWTYINLSSNSKCNLDLSR